MDTNREREDFEKYIQTVAHPHRSPKVMFFTVNDGYGNIIYCDISIQNQWETWQARAQSVPANKRFNLSEFLEMEQKLDSKDGVITADLDRFIAYAGMVLEKAKALKEPK